MLRSNWFHILSALVREDMHGSAIADDVLDQTDGSVRLWPATLYRTLDQMSDDGLIEELSGDRHPEGVSQKRRYYRVTVEGRRQLAETAEQLSGFAATARERLADRNR